MSRQVRGGVHRALGFVSHQQRPFKVNIVRAAAQNFLWNLTLQYQSIYTIALGATPFQLGLVNSSGGVAAAAISMPTGWLTERYGIRRMFLVATPLMALGALIFASAQDWLMVIPALFLVSLSTRMMLTACAMVCGSYLKTDERATGMQLCDTLSAIPRIISPMLAALIITQFGGLGSNGIRPLYYLQMAGFASTFILVLTKFEDPLRGGSARKSVGFVEGINSVLARGAKVKIWIGYVVLSTTSWFISNTYISVYAAEVRDADQFVLGGMATASTLIPLALSLAVGRMADTFGRKKVILLMTPIYSLSYVLLLCAQSPSWIILSGVFQGFFMLVMITENAMSAELVPLQLMGSWFGLLGLFRGLAGVAGPFLGGLIWSSLGPDQVLISIIILEAMKLALLMLAIPETLKKKQ